MRSFLIILSILLMASTAGAEDFWKGLKGKVSTATPKKSTTVTTAVGGIRGAQEESADSLYWKGKEVPFVVDETELLEFNSALDIAMQGSKKDALAAFQAFVDKYPESVLKGDAMDALAQISIMPDDVQEAPLTPQQETDQVDEQAAPSDAEAVQPAEEVQQAEDISTDKQDTHQPVVDEGTPKAEQPVAE